MIGLCDVRGGSPVPECPFARPSPPRLRPIVRRGSPAERSTDRAILGPRSKLTSPAAKLAACRLGGLKAVDPPAEQSPAVRTSRNHFRVQPECTFSFLTLDATGRPICPISETSRAL